MKIEFDPKKAEINPLNHDGVTFEEAKPVLLDPYALTKEDHDAEGEQRFISLGVVWTQRGDSIRLVSAWKANQQQRKRYEEQF
ncbi:BrnT family toxin [Ferrovum sp.]|jgi:hypothetical protein|uniref:BrnT family toxin n=1 Tax=Ferrovum sp. TaxID=2609467 RepID=UPI00261916BE|nr:BrnT family toxin [Ferrovum sp.]